MPLYKHKNYHSTFPLYKKFIIFSFRIFPGPQVLLRRFSKWGNIYQLWYKRGPISASKGENSDSDQSVLKAAI